MQPFPGTIRGDRSRQAGHVRCFADGELFTTPDEVRAYFTVANLTQKGFSELEQNTLDEYAREVVAHGWHMEPFSADVVEDVQVSFGGSLAEIWHWLQGFRSGAPCNLVQQTAFATPADAGHRPGARLCTGTVRQVMDWIEAVVESERPVS